MSPAPGMFHQSISGNLYGIIWNELKNHKCKAFSAPFDVRLPLPENKRKNNKVDTVVQPDICVVCDPDKLDQRGCNGAPDWIIEILSKGTSKRDLTEKYQLYQNAGVKEYWVVHPTDGTIIPYILDEKGEYQLTRKTHYSVGEKINVHVFNNFEIDLEQVFDHEF